MRALAVIIAMVVKLALLGVWLVGIVLANGFWSTVFAIVMPLWAYYLVAERIVVRYLMEYL